MKDYDSLTCRDQHNKRTETKINMIKTGVILAIAGIFTLPSIIANANTTTETVTKDTTTTYTTSIVPIESKVANNSSVLIEDAVVVNKDEEVIEDNWTNHIPIDAQHKIEQYEYQKKADWYKALYAPAEEENEVIIASATTKDTENNVQIIDFEAEETVSTDDNSTETSEPVSVEEPVEETTETTSDENSDMTFYGTLQLTAYTWTGNPCADGVYPSSGYTVACNNSDLWHKWIYIEGYGAYYVHDTGGMGTGVIDVYMDSYDACIQFGRRSANIYVYN